MVDYNVALYQLGLQYMYSLNLVIPIRKNHRSILFYFVVVVVICFCCHFQLVLFCLYLSI